MEKRSDKRGRRLSEGDGEEGGRWRGWVMEMGKNAPNLPGAEGQTPEEEKLEYESPTDKQLAYIEKLLQQLLEKKKQFACSLGMIVAAKKRFDDAYSQALIAAIEKCELLDTMMIPSKEYASYLIDTIQTVLHSTPEEVAKMKILRWDEFMGVE